MELTDPYDVELALKGKDAWKAAARTISAELRGALPCENFVRYGGQMKLGQ